MNENRLNWNDLLRDLAPGISEEVINPLWLSCAKKMTDKIIVLDDDPTGIQTVHSIPVFTVWDYNAIKEVFYDESKVVYILTNSRAMTASETESLHRRFARDLKQAAKESGKPFLLISRSDSTLRGHYPLETRCLYEEMGPENVDGEIIIPFFYEGGRITYEDIHYVKEGNTLVPAAQTEFAKDVFFGYRSSDLKEWIEEKTCGQYPASGVISISLELLRSNNFSKVLQKLMGVENFNKVIVNAVDYSDLKVFLIILSEALSRGKRFLFRTAASAVQVMGGVIPKPLLTDLDLYPAGESPSPGLVVVGSYVRKTTEQLEKLSHLANLKWVELNVNEAENNVRLAKEVERIIEEIDNSFESNSDVCVYTTREYYQADGAVAENKQLFSARVSDALVRVVKGLKKRPGFLVAKGGITSSDVGVKALEAKRAMVMGQIQPGVPVWKLGEESRFPGLSYVIFPGNVGDEDSLKNTVEILRK